MKKKFVVAALFICSQSFAQSDSSRALDAVVVTASKFPTKTSTTGKVVTVITRADIEHAGSKDLAQIINEQGGLYINGANSNPGKDKNIYLRGGRTDHTLITIDGIPVYDASGIGSNFDIRNLSIDNIERIEVLKGSQGTLYGADAIAGVINIITKKNASEKFSANAMASGGSYGTIRTNAGFAGKQNKLDYNVGYSFFQTDGISEADEPVGSTEKYDRDGYKQNSLEISTGIQAANLLRVQPYLRYTTNKGSLDAQGFVDDKNATYHAKNLQTGLRNELNVGAAKINLLYNYNLTDRDYKNATSESGFKAKEHFLESFYVQTFGKLKLTTGADFRRSNMDQSSTLSYVKPLGSDSVFQHQTGIYTALNYNHKALSIEGGGRWNNHSQYGENFAFNLNPSYLIQDQWKFFANLSTGYKTPSLYQLFSEYGNNSLSPEKSLNMEGGIQYFTTDQKASLRATFFHRDVEDLITFFFDPVTYNAQYINRDRQKDKGVEVDGKLVLDRFRLNAFYSFADGAITTKQGNKDTSYYNLYRRPKHSATITAGTQWTKSFYTSLTLQSVNGVKDLTFEPPTFQQKEVNLKNYLLVSINLEYKLTQLPIRFFADVRNITDTKYAEIYGYQSPGLNAYGGMRVNF